MARWRWLEGTDELCPESSNMRFDQALLDDIVTGGGPHSIRVYRWPDPWVTFGRFQDEEAVRAAFPGRKLSRRPTGGSAVDHTDDLTVSVAASEETIRHLSPRSGILTSYRQILSGVLDTLAEYSVEPVTGIDRADRRSADCFASVGKCDVVDQESGEKIIGCAQVRSQGAILQQMSIRPHWRYDLSDRQFVERLKANFALRLSINQWELSSVSPLNDIMSNYFNLATQS